jgi:hypothetical protein
MPTVAAIRPCSNPAGVITRKRPRTSSRRIPSSGSIHSSSAVTCAAPIGMQTRLPHGAENAQRVVGLVEIEPGGLELRSVIEP